MFGAACLAALIGIIYSLYRWRKKTFSVFKELGIPGPEPSLISGNLQEIEEKGMAQASSDWLKEYGDIVGYYNGVIPGVVLRDPELIKRIFINDFKYFTGRQIMASVSKCLPVNEVRLTRISGNDWRHVKNIVLPAFKTSNIKKAFPLVQECAQECFQVFDSKSDISDGCIEVFEPFCHMAADFGLLFFAGARTNLQRNDAAAVAVLEAARKSVGQFGGTLLFFLNLLPESRLLHKALLAVRSFCTQLPCNDMLDRMEPIISHRRQYPDPKKEDVLQLLLNSEVDEASLTGNTDGRQLSSRMTAHPLELRTASNTCLFITIGIEAVAIPLAFTCYLLAEHPDIQDKVRAEVLAALEKDGELTYGNTMELTYLGQVISECIRLYPSLPGSIRRMCDQDYEHNGIRIPKGMNISVPTLVLHYDPDLWPEPTKFDPERFSKANKDNIRPMSYFPYGIGPRRCIAPILSQMMISLTLAMLVKRYRILPSGRYEKEPPVYATTSLLGLPKEGIWVKLEKI